MPKLKQFESRFKLETAAPKRRQQGEPPSAHAKFLAWVNAGYPSFVEFAKAINIKESSVSRYDRAYKWSKRKALIQLRETQALGERMYGLSQGQRQEANAGEKATPTAKRSRAANIKTDGELSLAPPPPIEKGLHRFALQYAHLISPGFEIDAVVDVMLTELEQLVEGESGQRLMINPPPRHSKTTCAILALTYSLLRYPDRGHVLVSANGRLSALSCSLMKTLFEYAVPDGFKLKTDQKSKLAWSPDWEGARVQLSASRGGALLGYTGHIVLVDDIVGSIGECESTEIMDQAMRTIGVDIMTRLTKDKAGKAAGLCLIAQRLGPSDPTARLIDRDKGREKAGERVIPWRVVASPAISPNDDQKARILADYPHSWDVKFPRFGRPGEPVSRRFDVDFFEALKSQMPPADFAAMYQLDCSVDVGYCSWRHPYLQPIALDDIKARGSFIAIDMNLSGEKGSDTSALVAATAQDGKVVILGVHELHGYVEDILPQILDFADKYDCHTLGVEKAAAGHQVLRSLKNSVAGKTFNVVPLHHEGKSKRLRQQKILGFASQGKLLIRDDCPLTEVLHQQQRSIALDRRRDRDDYADAMNYAASWVWDHWILSGFTPGGVRWQGGSGGIPGVTECTWGRGVASSRTGLDGVERYGIWDD